MVVPRRPFAITAAALVAVLALLGAVASAQTDDAPAGVSDEALLDRLAALEDSLPVDPAPTAVTVERTGEEGDETWGTFDGDVTGQAAVLETLNADLTRLYVDADDVDTEVGDAVAEVARGWLDLGQGYRQLAEWDGHDLAFPLSGEDDDGVSVAADELRGRAEAGLRLVLGARVRHLAGYVALRELGSAEPAAQTRFDARATEAEAFDAELKPEVHRLLSLRSTEVLVTTERFATDAPGNEARARSMTVTCVDREFYTEAARDTVTSGGPGPQAPDLDELPDTDRADCPDLPPEGAEQR